MTLTLTPIYAALAGLMLLALSVRTLLLRRKAGIAVGNSESGTQNLALARAVRAHGNFVEYTPFTLLLIAFLELRGGASLTIHILACALLVGRIIHALGISRVKEDFRFRVAGMVITLSVLMSASVRLLLTYL